MKLTDAAWEELMRTRGLERANREFEKRAKASNHAEAPAGRDLIQKTVEDLGNHIAEYLVESEAGAGAPPALLTKAGHLDPFVLAFVGLRSAINHAIAGSSMLAGGRQTGRAVEAEVRAAWMQAADPGRYKAIKDAMQARLSTDERHLDRVLKANAGEFGEGVPLWSEREARLVGLTLLDLVITFTGLLSAEPRGGSRRKRGTLTLVPTEGLAAWLTRRTEMRGLLAPQYAPKLVLPVEWSAPRGGGYTEIVGRPLSIITRCRADQWEALETADMSRVYGALNRLQETRWRLNVPVLNVLQTLWGRGMDVAGLPARENRRPSPYPEGADAETIKAWKRKAAAIHTENAVSLSGRLEIERILYTADALRDADAIYFPYRTDFRGRVYAVPEGLSPQGGDVAKSLLTFADAAPVGDAGLRWLKIHGANAYGYDKATFDGRVKWADEHTRRALATASDPLRDLWWTEADSPFQLLAWCFEMDRVLRIDGRSSLPLGLDGSCNGLQHFSALLRDPIGGAAVNLVPSAKPQDVYQAVANRVMDRLRDRAVAGDWVARGWLDFEIDRKITKRPVMVLPYGGTITSCMQYVREAVLERVRNGEENPFGDELGKHCGTLASEVWKSIGETVVAAREAMGWLQQVGRGVAKAGAHPHWVAPSGFPVVQVYDAEISTQIKTHLGGRIVQLRENRPTGRPDPARNALAISPNFVHSLDAAALVATVNAVPSNMPLSMIHDSYGTRAGEVETLARVLREQFVAMYEVDCPLRSLYERSAAIVPDLPPPPPRGGLDIRGVLDSPYFFA